MKKFSIFTVLLCLVILLSACAEKAESTPVTTESQSKNQSDVNEVVNDNRF